MSEEERVAEDAYVAIRLDVSCRANDVHFIPVDSAAVN